VNGAGGPRVWIGLAAVLGLAAALVLSKPVTSWRTGADEAFYLHYATRIATDGPAAFPLLFRTYLGDPVASQLYPSPARVAAIAYDALAVRLGGARFEALAYGSLLAFLGVIAVTFAAARPIFGDGGALSSALLVATAPLGLGMARRALTDCLNAFVLVTALALIIRGIADRRGRRWWGGTALVCAAAFLVKELNLIVAAFAFVFIGIDALRHRRFPAPLAVACVSVVPAALAMAIVALAAGGIAPAWHALSAVVTQPGSNEYAIQFGGGPWYRYLVDHLVLSPWSTLLYVMWLGCALGTRPRNQELIAWTLVPLLFLVWVLPFAKFVRWALFLDVPMRIGVVALLRVREADRRGVVTGMVTALLVATQLAAFHRFFVVADVYDPTSVQLLGIEGFLPMR